tara:strand:+ start:2123 stop:2371 length:249 start_codon:yes stop_codon:yes gene_type:complete
MKWKKKFIIHNMKTTKQYTGEYISLFDHLGRAAGGDLGTKVAYAAAKAGVKHGVKQLNESYYTGEIYIYPSDFLVDYFNNNK